MRKVARVAWWVVGVIGLLTILQQSYPLISKHPRLSLVVMSVVLLTVLLYFLNLIRRYHERVIRDTQERHLKIAKRILRLGEIAGEAGVIDRIYCDKEDEAPQEVFETWVGLLQTALSDTFGPDAVSDFTNGHPEALTVPSHRHVWFATLREQVSNLIDRQTLMLKSE